MPEIRTLHSRSQLFNFAMTTETIHERARYLVNNFDFAKVQKMMAAVDWKWGGPYMNDEFGVPTIEAMQRQAYQLILEAHRLDCSVSSGGFEAFWVRKEPLGLSLLDPGPGMQIAGSTLNSFIGLRFIAAEVRHRDT
ncbi:hypothetical protein UFOVP431_26 [uncultured Caudovirales phage]|uniref:Uncharacterized protein n=1 Tax=uncultured Caudovirales phage TaxID=2100421 RepID=A0A6J5MMZ5_9CAUD|nr:hypothetical protein UFOVP431_26 [uncultured Caudovirales phage]